SAMRSLLRRDRREGLRNARALLCARGRRVAQPRLPVSTARRQPRHAEGRHDAFEDALQEPPRTRVRGRLRTAAHPVRDAPERLRWADGRVLRRVHARRHDFAHLRILRYGSDGQIPSTPNPGIESTTAGHVSRRREMAEKFEYLGVNHVALVCKDMKET